MRRSIHLVSSLCTLIFASWALVSCGGLTTTGGVASKVKPKKITATSALGESVSCENPDDEAELLIVDLPGSRRGDMEIAMSEGLIAIKYDCKSLKILKNCKIPGSYAYKGTLLKEELVRLENADEIRANLPLSGVGVAEKMGAELERGATLDLAMALVGQQRAARYEVARNELRGRCKGATHFVQSVYVGAFAMKRGERAKAAAAAEVFGVGASAASASSGSSHRSDGSLEACRTTNPNASKPNRGCGALLRLYLLPISPAGSNPTKIETFITKIPACPRGMARVGGKCVRTQGPICSNKTPKACISPCKKGDNIACTVYGVAVRYGKGLTKDRAKAAKIFARGCELGSALSCAHLSKQYHKGKGVEKDSVRSAHFAKRGCALGSGSACFSSGIAYMNGKGVTKNEKLGFSAYEQGCAAGHARSCTNLGKAYSKGKGVTADIVRSFNLYVRACEGGSATGCYNVGTRLNKGKGVQKNLKTALRFFTRGCRMGKDKSCRSACKYGAKKLCK